MNYRSRRAVKRLVNGGLLVMIILLSTILVNHQRRLENEKGLTTYQMTLSNEELLKSSSKV